MAAFRDKAPPEPAGFGTAGATKGLILAKAGECESLFVNILQTWTSNGEDRYEFVLRKLEKRFLNWAAYLGVIAGVNGSLDHRLERHPRYRDLILMLLKMLSTSLLQVTANPSEQDADDVSEDVSDEEEDIHQIELEGIRQSLNELDRLAMHIRHSPASALDGRVRVFETTHPAEAYSFNFKARLAVDCLYPRAPVGLRRYLSQLMTQTHMRFLYWQSHDKKLRKDRRFDRNFQDGSTQMQQDSPLLLAKRLSPQPSVIDRKQALLESEGNNTPVSTSMLSETLPLDLDSGFTIPAVDAEMPAPRRAGASTVLESRAKFPDPPKFENGEVLKPCPLCRKNFSKAEFTDSMWWKCHVNEDLLPFTCIAGQCLQRPAFACRSEWRAHIQRYHSIFWQRYLAAQIANCPFCRMPLVEPRRSAIDSDDVIESRVKNAKNNTDSDEKTATDIEESVVDHLMNLMMNHIADHLQFLALLTVRLSARKISDGDDYSFSSSQASSSDQDYEEKSTLDDKWELFEGDGSKEEDEYELVADIPPDLECPEDQWIESLLRNHG